MECHASLARILRRLMTSSLLENSKCSSCHDPHSSDTPKLLLEFSMAPYAARLCSACHPRRQKGKVELAAASVDCSATSAHAIQSGDGGTKSLHKLLSKSDRSCMECHDPMRQPGISSEKTGARALRELSRTNRRSRPLREMCSPWRPSVRNHAVFETILSACP